LEEALGELNEVAQLAAGTAGLASAGRRGLCIPLLLEGHVVLGHLLQLRQHL
jgi:hypothetical protein